MSDPINDILEPRSLTPEEDELKSLPIQPAPPKRKSMPDPLISEIVSLARELWPDASGFKVTPPTYIYSESLGTKITNWTFTWYHRDCDGDELASYLTAPDLPALRDKLLAMKQAPTKDDAL